jgi:hypothetical protein
VPCSGLEYAHVVEVQVVVEGEVVGNGIQIRLALEAWVQEVVVGAAGMATGVLGSPAGGQQ